ncbi:Ig-like domain-containing protein [Roseivirga sp.]|uniref:Ig-like domain-containing protein n=1 Tax=Roseivirga sp. TaxID=1964215 RepID=UPI003B8CA3CD
MCVYPFSLKQFFKPVVICLLIVSFGIQQASAVAIENGDPIKILSAPVIHSFTTPAIAGMEVLIKGENFTATSVVSFGGVNVTYFEVVSASEIKATIASTTSGSVSVTTPSGTATKSGFVFGSIGDLEKPFNAYESGFLWDNGTLNDFGVASVQRTVDFNPFTFVGPEISDERGVYTFEIFLENFHTFPGRKVPTFGLASAPLADRTHDLGTLSKEWGLVVDGDKIGEGSTSSYSSSIIVTDRLRVVYNATNQTLSYERKPSSGSFTALGDAFTNVTPDVGENLHLAGSVNCLGSCVFILEDASLPEIAIGGTTTNFGDVNVGTPSSQTYTISNTGKTDLNITGVSNVSISGTDAADFTVTTQPSATIASGESSDFVVKFDPSSIGNKNATVTVNSNDSDEAEYTFKVKGNALASGPQIRLTKVDVPNNRVIIKNFGGTALDISGYWFCHSFAYHQVSDGTVVNGSTNLAAGAQVELTLSQALNNAGSDLSFYSSPSFGASAAMVDFTQWGSGGNGRENVAVAKGIWTAGQFVNATATEIYYGGTGTENGLSNWSTTPLDNTISFPEDNFGGGYDTDGIVKMATADFGNVTFKATDDGTSTAFASLAGIAGSLNRGLVHASFISTIASDDGLGYTSNAGDGANGFWFVFATDNGSEFKLKGFDLQEISGVFTTYEVLGFRDGVQVVSESVTVTPSSTNTVETLTEMDFQNVDEIRIRQKTTGYYDSGVPGMDGTILNNIILEAPVTNTAPTATNVNITGTLKSGEQLTGTYTWADTDNGDTEGGSTFKWYRSNDDAGIGKTEIAGATTVNYTLTNDDINKFISFEVTPNDGTTAGTPVESSLQEVVSPLTVNSIVRQTPTTASIPSTTNPVFRVTFSREARNVSTDDFLVNSTVGGTINNVNAVDAKTYDVAINNLTNTNGTLALQIKGIDGATGTNDIVFVAGFNNGTAAHQQTTENDFLNQSLIGQSFTAASNNFLTAFTLFARPDNHTFSGTARLRIFQGDASQSSVMNDAIAVISDETVNITTETSAAGQTFTLTTPPQLTSGTIYSIVLDNFTGSGDRAFFAHTAGSLSGGRAFFTNANNTSHAAFDFMIDIFEGTEVDGDALFDQAPTTDETYTVTSVNLPPTASNVNFSGTLVADEILTGSYDYSDAENDIESGTTFRWLRADDAQGTNQVAITGATSQTYTLTADDLGSFISFEVTPNDGITAGTPVESALQGPIPVVAITTIARQTPTDAITNADQVVFRVTFDGAAKNVDISDFSLSGTAAGDGTVSTVTPVSGSIYDVTVTGLTNSNGTVNLDIKGNATTSGSNDITNDPVVLDQSQNNVSGPQSSNNAIGQSFIAGKSGGLTRLSVWTHASNTYVGTTTLTILNGAGGAGSVISTTTVNITGTAGEHVFDIANPPILTSGQTYTFFLAGVSPRIFLDINGAGGYNNGSMRLFGDFINLDLDPLDLRFQTFITQGTAIPLSSLAPATDETFTISNNVAPTATNVTFTGIFQIGQQLTGAYTFTDADNDPESGSTFKWYRSDDAAGTGKTEITGATTVNYTLTNDDINKFISFEVTPNDGTTAGTPVETTRTLVANVFITSIARQTPSGATTNADEVTFRVIFSAGVARVSADDFILSGTVAGDGTVSSITRINGSTYDVKVTGIDISEGTINLDLKGADAAGTNNIIKANEVRDATNNGNLMQDSGGDTFFWQSFVAEQTGLFHSVTLRKSEFSHTYEGTATLKLYIGEGTGGTELASQQIFTSQSSGDETYYFELPASIFQGTQYTWFWQAGTGTGATGFSGQTGNSYGSGRGLSEQFPAATSLDWYFITQTITGAIEDLGSPVPTTDETYTIVNPPMANNVAISGTAAIGQQLTGSYSYSDPQSNAESGTTFRWFMADDANGTGKTAISSATTTTYTVQAADAGKFLVFEVTASDGTKTGDPTESVAEQVQLPLSIQSIARHTPTTANITADIDPVFRVIFSEDADNVTVDDFVLNSTAGGTVSSFNAVDGKTYDLTVNSLNNVDGALGLKVKGIDGAAGTNDVSASEFVNGAATHQQTTENDFLNQARIGQSFTAASNNYFTGFTLFAKPGTHTFSGTARLRIIEGDASNSTVLNDANAVLTEETVNISSGTDAAGQAFIITNPPQLTSGMAYSLVLDLFTGSGDRAYFAHTAGSLAGGRAFFTGSHNGHAGFDFMIDIFENPKVVKNLFDQAPTTDEAYIVEEDLVKPTVTITSNASNPQNGFFTATFTFSEDVTGFAADDITVVNGAAGNFQTTSAKVYTATITPTATDEVTIDVAADKAQDLVGNNNTAATQLSVTNDQTKPTLTITASADPTSGAFTATFTFDEDVTGFTVEDISVGNGAASNFNATSAKVYTASITPTADGAVTVDVAADIAQDAALNTNTAATQLSITNDETRPIVTITSTNITGFALGEFPITITFSESVTGFVEGDITLSNGIVKTGTFSGSGTTYIATIEGTNHGTVTVDVETDKANDAAGNGNTAATQFSIENDVISPNVTISRDGSFLINGPFTATFTFDEDVTGFTIDDISLSNGAASNFSTTNAKVYTATIAPIVDGEVTVDVPVLAATDIAGNFNNAAVQLAGDNDETKPTLIITPDASEMLADNFTAATSFDVVIQFSEDILPFDESNVSLTNGTLSNWTGSSTGDDTFTFTFTPTAQGPWSISVAADETFDFANNGNVAASVSGTFDTVAPTLTMTSDADPTNAPFTLTMTFSEPMRDFVSLDDGGSSSTITNANVSNEQVNNDGSVYTYTVIPINEGDMTITFSNFDAVDRAGTGIATNKTLTVEYDNTAPTVVITASADPTSGAFTGTFTFSEDVRGFEVGDIVVGNGTASNFQRTSAKVYTATVTPTADGNVTVDVAADKANDAAGNENIVATQLSVTNDETKPAVTITASDDPQSGAFTATFTLSEDVTGFTSDDISVGNGAASNFNTTSANVYTATITPVADGAVTIDVAADKAQDAAGNNNTAATQLSVTNDETKPTVTITSDASNPQSGAFTATFTFTEAVTGFVIGDISVGNGSASNFNTTSANVYTATITPVADGGVTIDVAADRAQDAAGNNNTAATQLSVTNDETSPTVTVTSDANDPQSGAFTATFTFSEAVTGFTSDDISVGNGAASNFNTTSANVYTATITPVADGAVTIDVAADKAQDAAGNNNTAATQLSVTNDETKPAVTITASDDPQSGAFTATFTLSEDVTGFTSDDISVGNGAASNFNTTSANVYTATITPVADGAVTIDVAADKAQDAAGNNNTAATQLSVTNDETSPTVTVTSDATDPQSGAYTATFTFSEDVTGFTSDDISVGNGAASNFNTTSASVYTATVTPTADGNVTVDVAADKAQDAAGNNNTAATQLSVTNDETKPTVTITSDANDPQSGAFTATFTFSEAVTGFTSDDISVGNGAASNFNTTSASVYTATITPTVDGAVTIDVAADKAQDAAGNNNTAATQLSVTNDETKPTVTVTSDASNPQSGVFTATFTFSEVVTGFTSDDISVGNGAASNFNTTSANVYTATITPVADGAVTIDVAADKAQDAAGNNNTAATQLSVTNDETSPTVTLSSATTSPVNGVFMITAQFNEPVSGFDAQDITSDGVISDFTAVDGDTYTFSVGSVGASVTVSLMTNVATDAAGNANMVSNTLNLAFDITPPNAPTIGLSAASDSGVSETDNVTSDDTPTIEGTAEANAKVEVFVDESSIETTEADNSGNWSLTLTTSLSEGNRSITATATDAAQNLSEASSVLMITVDTSAPAMPSTVSISDDTGTNSSDGVTSDNTLGINGIAEANSTVEVFIDNSSIGTTTANNAGTWSLDHTGTSLNDGTLAITARTTDIAGNTSSQGSALPVTIDTSNPTATLNSAAVDIVNTSFNTTVTYDEGVENFELSDVTVINGTASNLQSVTAGRVWTVDITPTTDGTTSVSLAINTANDIPGNGNNASNTLSRTFDGTAPTVSSVTRLDGDGLNTATTEASFRVVFSEDVKGVDITDFEVSTTGTATAAANSVTQVDGSTYDVNVNGISGEGTIGLKVKNDDSIEDRATNPLGAIFNTGAVYTTNFAPTAINTSLSSISENNEVGDAVGMLTSTDADNADTHTYALVSGTGDTDNGAFTINNDQLLAAESFDFETRDSYSIRIRTEDSNGGSFEQVLAITIGNVLEASIILTATDNAFDQTILGFTETKIWTIENNGEKSVEIRATSLPAGFSVTPASVILAVGATTNISINFTPQEARQYSGTITFNYEGRDVSASVTGEGVIVTSIDNGSIVEERIGIYPNPATDRLTIDLSEAGVGKLNIEVVNASGTRMFNLNDYTKQRLILNVSSYEQGVYVLSFSSGKSVVRKKLLIRR